MIAVRRAAIQFSARRLLLKAWNAQEELFGRELDVRSFLVMAPGVIAERLLRLRVQYEQLQSSRVTTSLAGYVQRSDRLIVVNHSLPEPRQRFTLAHEIGHWMLHTATESFRERPNLGDRSWQDFARPPEEVEADLFAASLLMPPRYLKRLFLHFFGRCIDCTVSDSTLAASISSLRGEYVPADAVSALTPEALAYEIAQLRTYGGRGFVSLAEHFGVSPRAMAIQLKDTGLVS